MCHKVFEDLCFILHKIPILYVKFLNQQYSLETFEMEDIQI